VFDNVVDPRDLVNDAGRRPDRVGYAEHKSGVQAAWADVEQVGERPVVYVGYGSHASYVRIGHHYLAPIDLYDDTLDDVVLDDYDVQVLPTTFDREGADCNDDTAAWLQYPGRWGQVSNFTCPLLLNCGGPTGPALQAKWDDPIGWT